MKLRKFIMAMIIMNLLVMSFASGVFAAPKNGMPPGQAKKTVENVAEEDVVEYLKDHGENLPPGILKNIIRDADLSEDSLEELEDEGVLEGLPGGILDNIYGNEGQGQGQGPGNGQAVGLWEVIEGTITDIDFDEKMIEIDEVEYELPDDIRVDIEDEDAMFSDLEVGMVVRLRMDEEKAFIEVMGDDYVNVMGIITGIDLDEMILEIDDVEYMLPEEVEVELDGYEATLEDLEVGMEVTLKIEDEKAEIEVMPEEGVMWIEGEIKGIDTVDEWSIMIEETEYVVSPGVVVMIDDEEADFEDLEVGMEAMVKLVDDIAMKIVVITYEMVSGEITALDMEGEYHITIDTMEYVLTPGAVVMIDGEEETLEDLEVGMEAEVKVEDGVVTMIMVMTTGFEKVYGEIMDLDLLGQYHITIDTEEYDLHKQAKVIIDGVLSTLDDLEIGMMAEVKIVDDEVVRVVVETE